MPLTASRFTALLMLCLALTACANLPQSNRYQQASSSGKVITGPVAELHKKALAAIGQQAYQQASDFLQRAIRIEPRNPFSWHYLAQNYWHSGDYPRCLAMLERSFSYSSAADGLDRKNEFIKQQCQQE